jgi:hypothetical protein
MRRDGLAGLARVQDPHYSKDGIPHLGIVQQENVGQIASVLVHETPRESGPVGGFSL